MMTTPDDIQAFWAEQAQHYVEWFSPWKTITEGDFSTGTIQWFIEGKLNVSVNCLDRHLATKANHPALIWQGDDEHEEEIYTFAELHRRVCMMANALKAFGIKKGDTVAIYLPMIPEAMISMLACTRIGAIHTVVFAGFSAQALRQRLQTSAAKLLISTKSYQRGGKVVDLNSALTEACETLPIKQLIVEEQTEHYSDECPAEMMDAEDPLFILYTSGSTGQPKGLVHTTGGYFVQTVYSFDHIFQCQPDDVFWCTADVGWITGHNYLTYGPLARGITTLMFAGHPQWPNPDRCWKIIDKYKVNVFYTAPTAIRALKRAGDQWLGSSSRESLRLLGSVGEPINPDVWQWYQTQIGHGKTPVVDTWWQTETGAIMLCPQTRFKPGSAGQPLPGIFPVILDDNYTEIEGKAEGALAIKYPWPAIARTIAGDHDRYRSTYFQHGYYITGDGAKRDADGDYWIFGRIDDVLNVSGHRLGTAEIESAIVAHPLVAEAAVVGAPHPIKGQGIYAFVSLKPHVEPTEQLKQAIIEQVKQQISAIAKPDTIQFSADLPKTRSGKIMRRILRKIANQEVHSLADLGDLSTLSNPEVVEQLISVR